MYIPPQIFRKTTCFVSPFFEWELYHHVIHNRKTSRMTYTEKMYHQMKITIFYECAAKVLSPFFLCGTRLHSFSRLLVVNSWGNCWGVRTFAHRDPCLQQILRCRMFAHNTNKTRSNIFYYITTMCPE